MTVSGIKVSVETFNGFSLMWPSEYHKDPAAVREANLKKVAAATNGKIVGSVVKVSA